MSQPTYGPILTTPKAQTNQLTNGSGRTAQPANPENGLSGTSRDVFTAINSMLDRYGLSALSQSVLGFIEQGYSSDTISILLQDTDAYKRRFAGNEARRKAGLSVLSPAEYLSVEASYREIMSTAGLPASFYDTPDDFTSWISNDVSPTEVKSRVETATKLVNDIDPATKAAFSKWYTDGDIVAYALDRDRATAVLERQAQAAKLAGTATNAGVGIDQNTAEQLANAGITAAGARAGFGAVAEGNARRDTLNDLYGDDLSQSDLINEALLEDSSAGLKRKGLASKERATFDASSAVTKGSLGRDTAGRF